VVAVEGLVWRLEELARKVEEGVEEFARKVEEGTFGATLLAERLEEWKFFAELSMGEKIDRMSLWLEKTIKDHFPPQLQEWWKEQIARLQEGFQEALEKIKAQIKEVGTWLSENADRVALGVGAVGLGAAVAGLGPERLLEDFQQFYQGAVVVVQVDLKERVAAFIEEARRLDDFAREIMGDIAQGKLPFSSYGETSYEGKADPNYGERLDPKGGPEPW
jgi:hypothetical protein